jgi:hypothetical protein
MATPIVVTHPELFHYTGIEGLEGIINTQTLWATHFEFSNDTSEFRAFGERLPDILRQKVTSAVEELIRLTPANRALIEQQGGKDKAVEVILDWIKNGIYGTLLGTDDTEPFVEPYITSFCTTTDEEDIAQHGLLSQWRGYGQEGGYAIVFDTARLELLLHEESEKWAYSIIGGADVIYSSDKDERIREEFGDSMDKLAESFFDFLTTGDPSSLKNTFETFTGCAFRYKHGGFHEEKEVRIVAIPLNRKLLAEAKASGQVSAEKPRKAFPRSGTAVPCIHLFEEITQLPQKPLPIKRIIIGPHRDKSNRQRSVKIMLDQHGLDIPVLVSGIPYVGHST